MLSGLWSVFGDPSDRLAGFFGLLVSLCECTSSFLLLAAHYSKDDIEHALWLADLALDFLWGSIYLPLALTVHDTFIVPMVTSAQRVVARSHQESWSRRRLVREVIAAILRLPFETLSELVQLLLSTDSDQEDQDVKLEAPTFISQWAEQADAPDTSLLQTVWSATSLKTASSNHTPAAAEQGAGPEPIAPLAVPGDGCRVRIEPTLESDEADNMVHAMTREMTPEAPAPSRPSFSSHTPEDTERDGGTKIEVLA